MKRSLVLAAILTLPCTFVAQQQSSAQQPSNSQQHRYPSVVYYGPAGPLSKDDVMKMSSAGVRDDLIIAELQKNTKSFHLTKGDISRLKNAGVSQRVIQAMMEVPFNTPAKATALANTAPAGGVTAAPSTQPGGVSTQPANNPPAADPPAVSKAPQVALPTEPGFYILAGQYRTKILGQPVTFERTGSRLVSGLTLNMKAAHDNVQLPGQHAQTVTGSKPVFAFVPSQHEKDNGVTAGDLLLIKLEVHGDRRQIEVAAAGAGRASSGVTITHQLQAVRSEPATGVYEITPADPLPAGEYAVYLQRGEGLPPLLYDFSVQSLQ